MQRRLIEQHRIEAACHLAGTGAPAADTLLALARDTTLSTGAREHVMYVLACAFGGPGNSNLLGALADDASIDALVRVQAATELAERKDPRGAAQLHALARDPASPTPARAQAANALILTDDPQALEILAFIAEDATAAPDIRQQAATYLNRPDENR
jgi:HEAT repeat protein